MPRSDVRELLLTIVAAATDAESFLVGLTPEAFERLPSDDPRTYRAIKNAVSELGEAVKVSARPVRAPSRGGLARPRGPEARPRW